MTCGAESAEAEGARPVLLGDVLSQYLGKLGLLADVEHRQFAKISPRHETSSQELQLAGS